MSTLQNKKIRGYQLIERIGKGGFGEVYRAYQPTIGREVAIKVIMPEHANQADFIRNFETEAKMVARLEHPFIMPLFDYWREPTGAYIVMRYLRGGTLKEEIDKGQMPLLRIADILDHVCSALWTAHRNNVAHRDIKPANIMLDEEGRAYLSDFGLAIIVGNDHYENLVGTWLYMPPERIQNKPQTHTVDIYSLGIMAFQMITGDYPFNRASINRLAKSHVSEFLPPLEQFRHDVPSDLNLPLQRATSKDPEDRYPDIRKFAEEFRQMIQPQGTVSDVAQVFKYVDKMVNPYMGLRPYGEADMDYFFGRIALVTRLLDRFVEETTTLSNFLALVGPSGSGKSSVIYAGLIPQLKHGALTGSESWYVTTMMPGSQPFQNLALALRSIAVAEVSDFTEEVIENSQSLNQLVPSLMGQPDNHLVLFIDQFEELFTQVDDEETRKKFLNLLTSTIKNPASNIKIVITLRADFYDKPLQYEEFGKLIQERTEVILPLNSGELERVIAGPAERVGLEVERELISEIINDVRSEPGALPLLQYTLTELFNRRDGDILTLSVYQKSGGVRGALARRADEVYQSLGEEHKQLARQLFLRLITLGEGTEDTRRRAKLSELHSISDNVDRVDEVLNEFNHYRLLTFDRDPDTREPTVEVAHEALIREWQQFQNWLDASRNDLRLQRMIATEVTDWKDKQDPSYLLRGNRLGQFEHWLNTSNVVASDDEISFIRASVEQQKHEENSKREQQEKEMQLMRKASRRMKVILMILSVAIMGGLALTNEIIGQNNEIQRERDSAVKAELEAEANLLNAYSASFATTAREALDEGNHRLALSFALEALKVDPQSDAGYSAVTSIAYSSGISRIIENDDLGFIYDIKLSKDGATAIGVTGASYSEVFQTHLPPEERRNARASDASDPIDFSTIDFKELPPPTLRIWDITTGETLIDLEGHESTITSLGFIETDSSPTLAYAATILGDVLIWDTITGEIIQKLDPLPHGYNSVSIMQDGQFMLGTNGSPIDSEENRLVIWDMSTGEIVQQFTPHASGLWHSAIREDGTQAISIYLDGTQVVWDTETGDVIQILEIFAGNIDQPNYQILIGDNGERGATNVGNGEVYL
jgi:hypothetical protein